MRYKPEHKAGTHKKIVEDAARRVRDEGITGAGVASVMRGTGLTHGGFYRHFNSKNDLLAESVGEAFRDMGARLERAAEQSPPAEPAWKAVVAEYLSLDHCNHPERGCPLAALAPELARTEPALKGRIAQEMINYKDHVVPLMPGRKKADRESAFFVILSTMLGAIEIARLIPDQAAKQRILSTARDYLLRSFETNERR